MTCLAGGNLRPGMQQDGMADRCVRSATKKYRRADQAGVHGFALTAICFTKAEPGGVPRFLRGTEGFVRYAVGIVPGSRICYGKSKGGSKIIPVRAETRNGCVGHVTIIRGCLENGNPKELFGCLTISERHGKQITNGPLARAAEERALKI